MYVAVYAFLAALGLFVSRRDTGLWLVAALLGLVVFIGTRDHVGCDFGPYLLRYESIDPSVPVLTALSEAEPGFQLLLRLVVAAGLDFLWLNLIAAALTMGMYFLFLRAQFNPLMILALLFPVVLMQLSMSGIRQGLATAALAAATVPFLKGQRLATGLWILFGAQFHASVAAFLPIAFLAGRQISTLRLGLGVMLAGPVAAYLIADRIELYQDRYVEQIHGEMTSGGAGFRYLLVLLPTVLFLLHHRQVRAAFPQHFELMKLFAIIALALAPLLVLSSLALHRLTYYVMPISTVTFVSLSHLIFPPAWQIWGRLLPVLIHAVYTIAWQLLSAHAQACFLPYRSYLLP